jgi:hypothetical protein
MPQPYWKSIAAVPRGRTGKGPSVICIVVKRLYVRHNSQPLVQVGLNVFCPHILNGPWPEIRCSGWTDPFVLQPGLAPENKQFLAYLPFVPLAILTNVTGSRFICSGAHSGPWLALNLLETRRISNSRRKCGRATGPARSYLHIGVTACTSGSFPDDGLSRLTL